MKKILILVMLLITVMSCELFDAAGWEAAKKELEEDGYRCVDAYDDGYTRTPRKCGYFR